jgi:hypothetical protein
MRSFLAFLLAASTLQAQARLQPPVVAEPGSELTISLLTMEHGSNVWELFGHNAILIQDKSTGTNVSYNWGVFSFRQPHFILRFLKGEMLYAMDGYSLEETIQQYRYLNRTLSAQVLNLTPAQKQAIKEFIEWNRRPENVNYRYDYFRDNCSTRVRDILDRALGGQLRAAASKKMTGTSYRWHALRLMQGDKPLVTGVDIGLGEPSDREISAWEEMFLPVTLRDFVRTLQVSDGQGGVRPLVVSEQVLFQATRGPAPDRPPRLWIPLLIIGVVVGALLVWMGSRVRDGSRGARVAAAVTVAVWSAAAGVLGLLLTLLWTWTDHVFAHRNENLLLFNPLWLILAVLAPLALVRGSATRGARTLAIAIGALAACAVVLHVTTLSSQANWAAIALGLPPALAIAWTLASTLPASAPAALAR